MQEVERDTFAKTLSKLSDLRNELGDIRNLSDEVLERTVRKEGN